MTTDEKILVDLKEAAGLLSVGASTFRRYVKEGQAPQPVKVGGAVRWRVEDLKRAFGCQSNSPTTP